MTITMTFMMTTITNHTPRPFLTPHQMVFSTFYIFHRPERRIPRFLLEFLYLEMSTRRITFIWLRKMLTHFFVVRDVRINKVTVMTTQHKQTIRRQRIQESYADFVLNETLSYFFIRKVFSSNTELKCICNIQASNNNQIFIVLGYQFEQTSSFRG